MKTTIAGFHQDEELDWVAELACGHSRHFRHRSARGDYGRGELETQIADSGQGELTTPEGRDKFLNSELDCIECDQDCQ